MTAQTEAAGVAAVVESARPVAEALLARGYRVYVVGGLVRDLFLGGGPSTDVDLTTDAAPGEVKDAVAEVADDVWAQGERFGTIGCRIGEVEFEVTTHRSESYEPGSRKPRVEFSSAIEADLSRRDFTVNAMALEVPSKRLVDPFHGAADLDAGVLRTPIDPERSFDDDPLRVLRAARFIAGYGLEPTPELVEGASSRANRLSIVSTERIRDEFEKLLALDGPGTGVRFLHAIGALSHVVAEAADWSADELEEVARRVDVMNGDPSVRQTARRALVWWTALGGVGDLSTATAERLALLRYSKADRRMTASVVRGIGELMRTVDGTHVRGLDDPQVRRLYATIGGSWMAAAEAVTALGHPEAAEALARRVQELEASESLDDLGPGLTGAEVMKALGLTSGPDVGEAMAFLTDIRLDEGPVARDVLFERLASWSAARDS